MKYLHGGLGIAFVAICLIVAISNPVSVRE
jgi:hypothetical protein